MPCAATIGSKTVCFLPLPPPAVGVHIGGNIIQGTPTVLIGGKPASCMGDNVLCAGTPPHNDAIARGSATVLIGGKPAAYMGCNLMSGGLIVMGEATVMIGM